MPQSNIQKDKPASGIQPFAELHSEELHEIISRPPSWLVRWGVTMFLGLILILAAACWFIRYPDVVSTPVTLFNTDASHVDNEHSNGFIGLIKVSQANLGKFAPGQKVLVKLDAYPSQQFGMVEGVLFHISKTPGNDGTWQGYVSFPQQLKTRYGHILPYRHGLKGQAAIITANKRLAERFFQR